MDTSKRIFQTPLESIALVTTVSNWELYEKTSKTFPKNIKLFVVDGTKGFFGLRSLMLSIEKFKKRDYKWLIIVDEDVIFTNPRKVFDIIEYMRKKDFTACGMRDGGTLKWRNENPSAINTFFCILDLSKIVPIFSKIEIIKNQYIKENEFKINKDKINENNYNSMSLFEHYYCFFFWLLRNDKKFLYLDANSPFNDETTLLMDHNNQKFLYHSWYARFYNINEYHTERINKILGMAGSKEDQRDFEILKNPVFEIQQFFYRNLRRITRKIC